jgi:DNA adenine methylase
VTTGTTTSTRCAATLSHRELAEALNAARAVVVLSGYASDLYDRELYAGWDRHTLAANTGNGQGDRARTEVLWSNRPIGDHPQLELWESA